jgi:UDP-N-acetylglucosamine acyltransferase
VIEESATLGGLVGIHQFCRIGTLCMIGGASKATQDVPPYMLADGAETHIRGVNVIGLKRRGFSDEVCDALKKAYRLLYRSNLNTSDALAAIEAEVAALPEIKRLCEFYRTSSRGVMR